MFDQAAFNELMKLVDCPFCMGKGNATVSREFSHDSEPCGYCKDGKMPKVAADSVDLSGISPEWRLTPELVFAAATIKSLPSTDRHHWIVLEHYRRGADDPRRVQALLDQASACNYHDHRLP